MLNSYFLPGSVLLTLDCFPPTSALNHCFQGTFQLHQQGELET